MLYWIYILPKSDATFKLVTIYNPVSLFVSCNEH